MKEQKTLKFEEKIKEIEKTLKELDSDILLDEAVVKYEAGMKYIEECEKELKQAEAKVHKLVHKKDDSVEIEIVEENEYPTLF